MDFTTKNNSKHLDSNTFQEKLLFNTNLGSRILNHNFIEKRPNQSREGSRLKFLLPILVIKHRDIEVDFISYFPFNIAVKT